VETSGRTLSRYKLLEEVGQGGMAVVWRGVDTTLNREVAVKVLHPHLAGQAESRARLQREAHAVAKLRHENILEIFDYSGPDSPDSYIVTEFIHGRTLKSFLVEHPLEYPELAEMIASELGRALGHAHEFGVIHRDIKPENVMIRDDGLVKLTDFGIAQIVDKERMTVTGQLLGSPAYMSPEHVEGRPLDFRTDVFALGVLTYQLATGQLPFRGKNPHEVLKKIADCRYAPPESINPRVGARLSRAIAKALERNPDARFPDVGPLQKELAEDLADAGVDDARRELAAFFADPKGWQKAFRPRLVAALTARGRALAEAGRTAAALELWSRALAVEPGSTELRTLVEGVARRQRQRRRLVTVAATLVGLGVAGAAGGALWHAMQRGPAPLRAPATAAAPVIVPAPGGPPSAPAPTVPAAPHAQAPTHAKGPRVPPPRVAPPPRAVPSVRVFELAPVPRAVQVTLDGKPLGPFSPAIAQLELGPGPHTLDFESNYCFPRKVEIAPDQAGGKLSLRLSWKPASLIVRADPKSADILVDDSTVVYRAESAIPVPISDRSSNGRRTVRLKVSAAGYESAETTVELVAGSEKVQPIALKPLAGSP
jgi:serine/threonine-protein kinase